MKVISSFHHFIPIGQQKQKKCFWFAEIKKKISSKTMWHLELLLCLIDVWRILYNISEPIEIEGSV